MSVSIGQASVKSVCILALVAASCSSAGSDSERAEPTTSVLESTVPETSAATTPVLESTVRETSAATTPEVEVAALAERLLAAAEAAGFAGEMAEHSFRSSASIYIDDASTQHVFGYIASFLDGDGPPVPEGTASEVYEDCGDLVIVLADTEGGEGLEQLRLLLPYLGCEEDGTE